MFYNNTLIFDEILPEVSYFRYSYIYIYISIQVYISLSYTVEKEAAENKMHSENLSTNVNDIFKIQSAKGDLYLDMRSSLEFKFEKHPDDLYNRMALFKIEADPRDKEIGVVRLKHFPSRLIKNLDGGWEAIDEYLCRDGLQCILGTDLKISRFVIDNPEGNVKKKDYFDNPCYIRNVVDKKKIGHYLYYGETGDAFSESNYLIYIYIYQYLDNLNSLITLSRIPESDIAEVNLCFDWMKIIINIDSADELAIVYTIHKYKYRLKRCKHLDVLNCT